MVHRIMAQNAFGTTKDSKKLQAAVSLLGLRA